MLNLSQLQIPFNMAPTGSLNSLLIHQPNLSASDPLYKTTPLNGNDLMSRRSLMQLLQQLKHPCGGMLRPFINEFDKDNSADADSLEIIALRLTAVINAARTCELWQQPDAFSSCLHQHWLQTQTVVLAGGLVSAPFGAELASAVEALLPELSIIASPWGGKTALIGMAETVACDDDIAVFDFGSTNVKFGIAHQLGNRIELLPEMKIAPFKQQGQIRADGLRQMLAECRKHYDRPLPVAISMAVYLTQGHPFTYRTGKYCGLRLDCDNLAQTLNQQWLPEAGFGELKLLAHDSSAAALSFNFQHPAMMLTLGTGLGSAPCPLG